MSAKMHVIINVRIHNIRTQMCIYLYYVDIIFHVVRESRHTGHACSLRISAQ